MIDKELNEAVKIGMKMGEKRKRKKRTMKVGLCFLLVISFIGAGINPTFADYIKRLPLIKNLYAETESINEAKMHGMVQYVNKSVEDNGVKVTIDSIQLYGDRWTIEYSIEDLKGDKKFRDKDITFHKKEMKAQWDESGRTLIRGINTYGSLTSDSEWFYNQEIISAENNIIKRKFDIKMVDLLNKNNKIPDKLIFEFDGIQYIDESLELTEHEGKSSDSKITRYYAVKKEVTKYEGKWNFVIYVDREKFNVEPIVLANDKVIDINGLKFNMEKLESYPTYTKIFIPAILGKTSKYLR